MIKFFRKIRYKLMETGKTGKYFKYAIGEILLVVIGILIALQINNWNENRKQNNLETVYLKSLKEEFQTNLKEVDRVMQLNAKNMKNALTLSNFIGPKTPKITEKEFADLLMGTINNEVQYRPGSGVINEIISSGKLTIFSNQDLKKALASLDGLLLKIKFQEDEEHGATRRDLLAMLQKEDINLRKIAFDAYGELFGLQQSNFTDSNLHLLQSKEFDNLLSGFIYTSGFMQKFYYGKLKTEIEKVIQIIDNQLNQ